MNVKRQSEWRKKNSKVRKRTRRKKSYQARTLAGSYRTLAVTVRRRVRCALRFGYRGGDLLLRELNVKAEDNTRVDMFYGHGEELGKHRCEQRAKPVENSTCSTFGH